MKTTRKIENFTKKKTYNFINTQPTQFLYFSIFFFFLGDLSCLAIEAHVLLNGLLVLYDDCWYKCFRIGLVFFLVWFLVVEDKEKTFNVTYNKLFYLYIKLMKKKKTIHKLKLFLT